MKLGRLKVDSTNAETDLCRMGAAFGTDKSPYSNTRHRHAYTAVYDLLFAGRRWEPIILGEVGILDNMSMHVWRNFFPLGRLYGFEFSGEKIEAAKKHALPMVSYAQTDIANRTTFAETLNNTGVLFDVLIDDSTHLFDHQINFVNVAVDFVKPGGIIVIEDVFRGWEEDRYAEALESVLPFYSSAMFVETNHANALSDGEFEPYYNNDKLLVMFRNRVARELGSVRA